VTHDICAGRHRGDPCSTAAYDRIGPTKEMVQERVLDFACGRGPYGFTCDELSEAWACSPNHSSPRVTELLSAGRLVRSGRRRQTRAGCWAAVIVLPGQQQTSINRASFEPIGGNESGRSHPNDPKPEAISQSRTSSMLEPENAMLFPTPIPVTKWRDPEEAF